MTETRAMQRAKRKLKKARQRRAIAAQRQEPIAETKAIADEQEALRIISRLRQQEREQAIAYYQGLVDSGVPWGDAARETDEMLLGGRDEVEIEGGAREKEKEDDAASDPGTYAMGPMGEDSSEWERSGLPHGEGLT